MELRVKFLLVFLLSALVQVAPMTMEECNNIQEENINLGTENANLKLKNFRLKGENYKLNQQIAKLLVDHENCNAFAENVDSISTSLGNIQQELRPLSTHFNLKFQSNKTGTDPVQEILTKNNIDNQIVMSERLSSFMNEMRNYSTFQTNKVTASLHSFFDEFKTTEKQPKETMPKNCDEAAKGKIGVFQIEIPDSNLAPFPVYCDSDNWMVILRRVDGTVDFERNWYAYKEGFGEITGNFIMGLEKLHQVTKSQCHELKVVVEDFENNSTYALYDKFEIDDEANAYALKTLGEFSGTAHDSLAYSKGMKFSTSDRDNDESKGHCAEFFKCAWWFRDCSWSRLTGVYFSSGVLDCKGINWNKNQGCYSLKYAKMMIRPTKC